jgi:phosphatidylserine decarboxylase
MVAMLSLLRSRWTMPMRIHRAGHSVLRKCGFLLVACCAVSWRISRSKRYWAALLSLLIPYSALIWFFRNPIQRAPYNPTLAIAPASGKILRIEEIREENVVRISIYLSLLDAHVSTAPVDGRVVMLCYTPGQYLVAFHPKASELNEQQTIVFKTPYGDEVRVRLIAGLIARRICCYVEANQVVLQGSDIGFIKFGSRVELVLPRTYQLLVTEGQRVSVGVTPIARRP